MDTARVRHQDQQRIWETEHRQPNVLPQMNVADPSSGVVSFVAWMKKYKMSPPCRGLEMGCGKGRNVIWLGQQGYRMTGFDFSPVAIAEAKKRAREKGVRNIQFLLHDAVIRWPFPSATFDFIIDCFAMTDIESPVGRRHAVKEMLRVLKPGGVVFVYAMSTDDAYHKMMIEKSPAGERGAFIHPSTGKFEKVFSKGELAALYKGLSLVMARRVPKTATFFGKSYACLHHWMIFRTRGRERGKREIR